MVNMVRVKARWSGFTGSPGYSNFYFREFSDGAWEPTAAEADQCMGKIHTFFDSMKLIFPPNVRIQVMNDCEVINDANGELQNVLTPASRAVIAGTSGAANYSAATGAVITWRTGNVRNGRRVRGRTFLVPTSSGAFDVDGSLVSSWATNLATYANTLISNTPGPELGIWARPTAPGAVDGEWAVVTAATVPDMAAVLRSRRD